MHPETNSLVAVRENISLAEGLRDEVFDKWMIQHLGLENQGLQNGEDTQVLHEWSPASPGPSF